MKSHAKTLVQVLFLLLLICIFVIVQQKKSQWDFLVFTQQWPQASCVDINNTGRETCRLEKPVKTWTIHGIWPSQFSGEGPFYCNNSYPFRESEVAGIEDELMAYWPNLIAEESKCSFWKHEWVKHGTCAMSLPSLDTEYKYFSQALKLNKVFDYKSILAGQGIVPSTNTYKLSDFRNAFHSAIGTSMRTQCIFSEDRSKQAIIQVEVCLDKHFTPIDCMRNRRARPLVFVPAWDRTPYNPTFEDCDESVPVQYLPLQYNV